MSTLTAESSIEVVEKLEYCTFRVGELLIGVDIRQVEEINRQLDVTPVPHARECVRGVINLRGEVVTVVDLRTVLGLPPAETVKDSRNVVVNSRGEQIGLLADRIGDAVTIRSDGIDPLPANFSDTDGRFFTGVYKLESELLMILDVDAALAARQAAQ